MEHHLLFCGFPRGYFERGFTLKPYKERSLIVIIKMGQAIRGTKALIKLLLCFC